MLSKEARKKLDNGGYTFEELKSINTNLKDFDDTGVSYPADEVFKRVNQKVFSKYTQNV